MCQNDIFVKKMMLCTTKKLVKNLTEH